MKQLQTVYFTLKMDDGLETAVRNRWEQLRDAGLPAPGADSMRPHITLAGYEQVDPNRFIPFLERFTRRRPAIPLMLHHLGIFPRKGVLFLAARVTRRLIRLQRELLDGLQATGFAPQENPHLRPDQWVPHCSLLIEAAPRQLQRGVALSTAEWQPLTGFAVGIGLVLFPEKADLFYFPFSG